MLPIMCQTCGGQTNASILLAIALELGEEQCRPLDPPGPQGTRNHIREAVGFLFMDRWDSAAPRDSLEKKSRKEISRKV